MNAPSISQDQTQVQTQLQELLLMCEQDRENAKEVREAIGRLNKWRVHIRHWLSGKKCSNKLPWRTHFVERVKPSLINE